jgi:hypothetical protein
MPTSFLTREGYDKLQDERDQVRTARRQRLRTDCTKRWRAVN